MKVLILVITLMFSSSVLAEDVYSTTGIGANLCFEYLDTPENSDLDFMYLSWAQGFISFALVVADTGKTSNQLNSDFLRRNLNKYCEDNPTKEFSNAVIQHITILNLKSA
jgi:hypothetical protein